MQNPSDNLLILYLFVDILFYIRFFVGIWNVPIVDIFLSDYVFTRLQHSFRGPGQKIDRELLKMPSVAISSFLCLLESLAACFCTLIWQMLAIVLVCFELFPTLKFKRLNRLRYTIMCCSLMTLLRRTVGRLSASQ